MKTEVLKAIRKAEEEYQAEMAQAKAEKEHSLAAATLETETLVNKARAGAEEYKKKRLEDARREGARKREEILKTGEHQASLPPGSERQKPGRGSEAPPQAFRGGGVC